MEALALRRVVGRCADLAARIESTLSALPIAGAEASEQIRELLGAPPDLVIHPVGAMIKVLYVKTIVDQARLESALIRPLTTFGMMASGALLPPTFIAEVSPLRTYREAVEALLGAKAVLLNRGRDGGWAVPLPHWPQRNISEPTGEFITEGPHTGFIESLETNIAVIRHVVPDHHLRWESIETGRRSGTKGALVFMEGLVRPGVLAEVRRHLHSAHPSFATDASMLLEWLAPRAGRFFPVIGRTERPDTTAAALLEGRVVILTTGSPTALLFPNVFANLLHSPEDYYARAFTADIKRILRVIGMVVSVLASPLFVALASVNQELVPTPLMVSLAQARRGVPLPLVVEIVILEIVVDIIREAGLRLPSPVGQSIAIIGAVVIGQAATMAGLVSAPSVVIVALAFIASFTMPSTDLVNALRTTRFPMVLVAAAFGLFGVTLSLLLLFAYLSSLESFGVPFLAPLTPLRTRALQDTLWRRSLPALRRSLFARDSTSGGRR